MSRNTESLEIQTCSITIRRTLSCWSIVKREVPVGSDYLMPAQGPHSSGVLIERLPETMDPSPKTKGLRPYPRQWNLVLVGAARLPERFGGFSCWLLLEGLLLGVVHSVNRHILFLRNRKPLSFSSKNRHRPTGRTIILITDLLTARSKFFAIC